MPVPVTPLTRVSARQARKLRWSHGLSISGQDGFGGAGRQTLTNRPQRMIVICPGTTRRPEGIGSDTGGVLRERPKPTPCIHSGTLRARPAFRPGAGKIDMPQAAGDSVTRGYLACREWTRSSRRCAISLLPEQSPD